MSANIQIFCNGRGYEWQSNLLAPSLSDMIWMGVIGTWGSGIIGTKFRIAQYAKNWFYDGWFFMMNQATQPLIDESGKNESRDAKDHDPQTDPTALSSFSTRNMKQSSKLSRYIVVNIPVEFFQTFVLQAICW
jgi:hypothetical protein